MDSNAAVVGRHLEAELGVAAAGAVLFAVDLRLVGQDPRRLQRHPRRLDTREHVQLQRQLLISLKQCTKPLPYIG